MTSAFCILQNPHQAARRATDTCRHDPIIITPPTLFAKKGKKKKGGGNKKNKKGGFEWASTFTLKPQEAQLTRDIASTLVSSFKAKTGKGLTPELDRGGVADIPKALWNAPVACMVADEGDNGATIVRYANVAGLETLGLKPNEFERLFSTSSVADKEGQDQPPSTPQPTLAIDLPPVMKGDKKYESGYKKKILKLGENDISIIDAHRWALEKSSMTPDGKFVTTSFGVAYAWNEWMMGDTTICSPGGGQREAVDIGRLEERIANQGAAIRKLKDEAGLGNKDPQVVDAVQELLRLKAVLEEVR